MVACAMLLLGVFAAAPAVAGTRTSAAPSQAVQLNTSLEPARAPTPVAASPEDLGRYRQRDQAASSRLGQFKGGEADVIVISASAGVVILAVVLLLILL
jgi:hypothetical protein